ncbi:hypothetical protein LTR37_000722 [Vermiconidia calcicola]|uniref:Uncharacterized protein n=1 Tax=Vermiconidia calcicola TaxID=1690605 RepID=A0ACC3NYH5_9PEZI|nr:hypothetical protein LTR37_000722 [Vermiconidia calcicola]
MDDHTIDPEIARLLSEADMYERWIPRLGVMSGALIAALLLYAEPKQQAICFNRLVSFLPWASFFISQLAVPLVVYLGIPKEFTFGIQICKILPASCEASMAIEGLDGLPCSGKRFREWIGRFLSNDGSYHLDGIERPWILCAFVVAVVSASLIFLAMVPKKSDRFCEKHGLAEMANDQEKQDPYASDIKADV